MEEEEGEFDNWNWDEYYDLLPAPEAAADGPLLPPLSSDGQCPAATPHLMIGADGSWALDVEVLSTLGDGGDHIIFPTAAGTDDAEDWRLFGHDWIHGDDGILLPDKAGYESQDQHLSSLDSSSGGDSSGTSHATADATMSQAQAAAENPCWGMDWLPSNAVFEVGADDSPPATGPNHPEPDVSASVGLPDKEEMLGMMMTLADMVRMAQECGNDEAEGRVWSEEEHKELLNRIQGYAELDVNERARRCLEIAFYLPKKTAKDVALRWRWLQDKEKTAKQAEAVEKGSARVKVKKGRELRALKKLTRRIPFPKVLDSKITTRELLRDSYIFLQRIEENIKAGKLDGDTADYFYHVKTIMDAVEKRPNEFCRMSMPMPPIDEQGLEEILHKSRHSSSASKEAAA